MPACTQCAAGFEVTDQDRAFYDKISPVFAGQKFSIPEPALCPDCRLQRRLVWRNERHLYRNTCAKTGDSMISWIAPDKPYKIYKNAAWWGSDWNALTFGREIDFNRPFFEQLDELNKAVPWIGILSDNTFNSDYVNFCNNAKDCYLLYASNNNEDCAYSSYIWNCKKCIDCLQAFDCQFCYSCIDVNNCYECLYSKNCTNCSNCAFSENCQNCQNCFGCVNLVGKQYCFMNEQLTKEEYEKKIAGLQLDSRKRIQEARQFFNKHRLKFPMRYAQVINCEESTGDALRNSKNVQVGFDTSGAQDCKWILIGGEPVKDCYDVVGTEDAELCYECCVVGIPASRDLFCAYAWKNAHELLYCISCPGSQKCFGCVGLQRGKYCILNKQYSPEEYEKMCAKLITHMRQTGEWGQFFPVNLSPFDYNETLAIEYFPLTREQVESKGWRWRQTEPKEHRPSVYSVPDRITEVPDDITNQTLSCSGCGKNYRVIIQELAFYKQYGVPVPHECPDCRHVSRMRLRNPRRLWSRQCAKCSAPIKTTYSTARPEVVYCEACYLKELY